MLNAIWVILILTSVLVGAWTGRMDEVARQSAVSAKSAVTLALGLVGVMAFWLGMMQVAREAGLLQALTRRLRPLMVRLFPDVPADHPAMSAMLTNIAANMLGLTNAATPFGIKAMMELERLNLRSGVATNAMALFLAINTSNLSLLPTGVIGLRTAMGSTNPASILFTTLFATTFSTITAIIIATSLSRMRRFSLQDYPIDKSQDQVDIPIPKEHPTTPSHNTQAPKEPVDADEKDQDAASTKDQQDATDAEDEEASREAEAHEELKALEAEVAGAGEVRPVPWGYRIGQWIFWLAMLVAAVVTMLGQAMEAQMRALFAVASGPHGWMILSDHTISWFDLVKDLLSFWMLPVLLAFMVWYAVSRGVKVYDCLVQSARDGFDVTIRIIPFLVAILVAIGMFRASGALGLLIGLIEPLTALIGMPAEALPMALLRPLSGSGAFGVAAEAMSKHGPDSLIGIMVSTFQGSTETTFYVLAVYFGAVQIKQVRHTLIACLAADTVGILAGVWICRAMFAP